MDKFSDAEIQRWISEDFTESRGDINKQVRFHLTKRPERDGFDLRDFEKLPTERQDSILRNLVRVFIRKHHGQIGQKQIGPYFPLILPKIEGEPSEQYIAKAMEKLVSQLSFVIQDLNVLDKRD